MAARAGRKRRIEGGRRPGGEIAHFSDHVPSRYPTQVAFNEA